MSDFSFFRSKLGHAALASIAAMLALNVVALNAQLQAVPATYAAAPGAIELA